MKGSWSLDSSLDTRGSDSLEHDFFQREPLCRLEVYHEGLVFTEPLHSEGFTC